MWTWVSSVFDGIPCHVADPEWLVRYVDKNGVKKGVVKRGAFTSTKYPLEVSVHRDDFCDTAQIAAKEKRFRAFVLASRIRGLVPAHVVADKPKRMHAMILEPTGYASGRRFPEKNAIKALSPEEWSRFENFTARLVEIASASRG